MVLGAIRKVTKLELANATGERWPELGEWTDRRLERPRGSGSRIRGSAP